MPLIKRFGEGLDQWYETTTGDRISCGENDIDELWWDWIISPGAVKYEEDGYLVFQFGEPVRWSN